jgi:hypothetical protein
MALDVPAGRAVRVTSGGTRSPLQARYLPIAEHGLIGRDTVALAGTDGTIDCYCCPRFDSPCMFAAILDADHGGLIRIAPDRDGWISKQLYLPDTNVLITRFLMPDGVGEVQDFMLPPRTGEAARRHRMIRRVVAVRGQMRFVIDVAPSSATFARSDQERATRIDGPWAGPLPRHPGPGPSQYPAAGLGGRREHLALPAGVPTTRSFTLTTGPPRMSSLTAGPAIRASI